MKKFVMAVVATIMAAAMSIAFTACDRGSGNGLSTDADPTLTGESDTLVVYFSASGNTQTIARWIAEDTDGELFFIQTETDYSSYSYDELLDIAQEEQRNDARPTLTTSIPTEYWVNYDTVFIGFPNWWGDMPMAVYSFLETYATGDYGFAGKNVVPFVTSGGSGFSNTRSEITRICEGATILEGLSVRDSNVDNARNDVTEWINALNL